MNGRFCRSDGLSRWVPGARALLLRLQRGQPCMWINADDAAQRGVRDGDRIRIWNDLGGFVTMAKVFRSIRPGPSSWSSARPRALQGISFN